MLAVYTLYQVGQQKGRDTIVVEYNPATGRVCLCSLAFLCKCAFYQFPCYGAYFQLYENLKPSRRLDVSNDPSVNDFLWTDFHPDMDYTEDKVDGESKVTSLFQTYVDESFLDAVYGKPNAMDMGSVKINDFLENEKYADTFKEKRIPTLGHSLFSKMQSSSEPCRSEDGGGTHDGEQECDQLKYNNLIVDFSRHTIVVKETKPSQWLVDISGIYRPGMGFNHAGIGRRQLHH